MTQISAMLSTGASLITDVSSGDKMPSIIFLAGCLILFIFVAVATKVKRLQKFFSLAFYVSLPLLILGIASFIIGSNASYRVDEQSSKAISQHIEDKYGVTFLDESDISVPSDPAVLFHKTKINSGPISASNAVGERIQVTLELVDNNTDVLAFSSGTEMKKVSK